MIDSHSIKRLRVKLYDNYKRKYNLNKYMLSTRFFKYFSNSAQIFPKYLRNIR